MRYANRRRGLRAAAYLFSIVIIVYVAVFMGTPYIVYQPGSASEIAPMIKVENGDEDEEGVFMMTTVSSSYANVVLLVMSAFNPHAEVVPKETRLGDHTEEEYAAEQVFYMSSSQSNAVEAAYRAAEIAYDKVTDYLFVFSVPGEGNKGHFQPGDRILRVDGEAIPDQPALVKLLADKAVGDEVEVELQRGGERLTERVHLIEVGGGEEEKRPGLGVMIGAVQSVKPEDPDHTVSFVDTRVGGPSAGLMFAMEIYNRLTPGDLTKGYRVAGTGTINPEGEVGPIGGIKHKIVAAERQRTDIFFVPQRNAAEAEAKAKAIGSDMKLVPVTNMEEALAYMEALPVKAQP